MSVCCLWSMGIVMLVVTCACVVVVIATRLLDTQRTARVGAKPLASPDPKGHYLPGGSPCQTYWRIDRNRFVYNGNDEDEHQR